MTDDVVQRARQALDGITPDLAAFTSPQLSSRFMYVAPQLVADLAAEVEKLRETLGDFADEPYLRDQLAKARKARDTILAEAEKLRAEVEKLRADNERLKAPKPNPDHPLEIRHGWLVEAGYKPDLIPGYGYLPDTDAAPLMQLSELPGWPDIEAVETERDRLRAEVQKLRADQPGAWRRTQDARLRDDNTQLRATIEQVREALAGHPTCDIHPDDDPITCGWKYAVADVRHALDGGTA